MPIDEVRVVRADIGCQQGQGIVMQNSKDNDSCFLALCQSVSEFDAQSAKEQAKGKSSNETVYSNL